MTPRLMSTKRFIALGLSISLATSLQAGENYHVIKKGSIIVGTNPERATFTEDTVTAFKMKAILLPELTIHMNGESNHQTERVLAISSACTLMSGKEIPCNMRPIHGSNDKPQLLRHVVLNKDLSLSDAFTLPPTHI